MDLRILDKNFQTIFILDAFKSLVWRESYYECGDFELFTEVNPSVLEYAQKDYYIVKKGSNKTMIIEDITIDTDLETGNFVKITGRSLESILDRRIVWGLKTYSGNFQNGIKSLINDCIISPSDSKRKIPNFVFEASTDSKITSLTLDTQWTGDNLYDIISDSCYENDIGFQVTLNDKNQFVFKLYAGVDRTYNQSDNPYVIFSPNFENLVNSNYYESNANLKTITLIGGEGEGKDRVYATWPSVANETGLDRREYFTDARDISSNSLDTDSSTITVTYIDLLWWRGKEKLNEMTEIVSFEGEVESQQGFIYEKDYYLGDVVQLENEYGFSGETRIIEVTTSLDETGYSVYPTFVMI